jgi:hypothetical protein
MCTEKEEKEQKERKEKRKIELRSAGQASKLISSLLLWVTSISGNLTVNPPTSVCKKKSKKKKQKKKRKKRKRR